MILTRISCGRMSISVAHLSFSQTWAPTWSHPNHYFVWTFIHQSMRFHKSYKSRYRLSASHSCAVFRVRVSSVPLIKRYFGLIKKWSIDNSLGEDGKASGSFYSFHGYRWTRNISIFSSTFFFVKLLKEMLGKGLLCGYTIVGSDEIVSPFFAVFFYLYFIHFHATQLADDFLFCCIFLQTSPILLQFHLLTLLVLFSANRFTIN